SLTTSDHFSITFRREHVDAHCKVGSLGIGLHIKSFDGCRVTMNHYRPVEMARNIGLVRSPKVAAPFKARLKLAFGLTFLQHLYRIVVVRPRKRRRYVVELRGITLELCKLASSVLEHAVNDEADELLCELHYVIQLRISNFRLHHPEFSQMAAG